jgi:hypothetical protein
MPSRRFGDGNREPGETASAKRGISHALSHVLALMLPAEAQL